MRCLVIDVRGVNVWGKGSKQFVVQGSQKEFPRELLEELKVSFSSCYFLSSGFVTTYILISETWYVFWKAG